LTTKSTNLSFVNPVSKTLSVKQSIKTIKQLVIFPLLCKTLFFKRISFKPTLNPTNSELTIQTNQNTHKLHPAFKQSIEICGHALFNIYNYLIIVSQKDIPLHRDFNIYTKVLKKQNKAFKLMLSHPPATH